MSAWCWNDGTYIASAESGKPCPECDEPMAPIPNPDRCDRCGKDWPEHKTGHGRCYDCTMIYGRKVTVIGNMNFEVSTAGVGRTNSAMRKADWEDE